MALGEAGAVAEAQGVRSFAARLAGEQALLGHELATARALSAKVALRGAAGREG